MNNQHRVTLAAIAHRVMLERGLVPDFPPPALAELDRIHGPAVGNGKSTRDLTSLPWCSIDNDDSRDLDQLTVAQAMPAGAARILVAIADVDAVVKKGSALDDHARQKHHLGLHRRRNVSDAAGEAFHGSHVPQPGVRQARRRRRDGDRQGWIAPEHGPVWSDGA